MEAVGVGKVGLRWSLGCVRVGFRFNGCSWCRESRAAMESGLCGVGLRFNGGN